MYKFGHDLPEFALFTLLEKPSAMAELRLNRTITAAEAEDYHSVQVGALRQAKVDLVSALTLNSVEEAVGIARAVHAAALPLSLSFTLDSTSRLQSGPSFREAIEAVDDRAGDARPDFYGINCSHPAEFEPALEPGDWIRRIRSLRPNAAKLDKIALCTLGHLESGDPGELGREMGALARRYPHLDVWGGCCGTCLAVPPATSRHSLRGHPRAARRRVCVEPHDHGSGSRGLSRRAGCGVAPGERRPGERPDPQQRRGGRWHRPCRACGRLAVVAVIHTRQHEPAAVRPEHPRSHRGGG